MLLTVLRECWQIRKWFDSADTDKNGVLSVTEFFLWSLEQAATRFGDGRASLEAVLSAYDTDKVRLRAPRSRFTERSVSDSLWQIWGSRGGNKEGAGGSKHSDARVIFASQSVCSLCARVLCASPSPRFHCA